MTRAADFTGTIGVNTHIAWQNAGSAYANQQNVINDIAYLGVTRVRDGVPYSGFTLPEYEQLARTGVRFDITLSGPAVNIPADLAQTATLATQAPGSVVSIEGPNEYNTQLFTFAGQSSIANPAFGPLVDQALYAAVKANPALSGASVIAASLANASASNLAQQGNLSAFVDSSNWHVYFGQGSQPGASLQAHAAQAAQTAPGKPVTITETGYYTAVDAYDWGGGGVDQHVQAIETVNALLDDAQNGVQATYLYELIDNIANPSSTDLEDSFGLFLADGTPKLAATAIHNLTSILADSAATAKTFQTTPAQFTLSGLPATASAMTLQKASGASDLVLWNEPPIWNQATKSELSVTPATVTVNLGFTSPTVTEYDPITGSAPIATFHQVSQVTLALGEDPLILEVAPALLAVSNPLATTYAPGAAGGAITSTGADTVLAGAGPVTVVATGPSINIAGGSGALTYSGTARLTLTGATGSENLTLSGANSTVQGGAGALTVLDTVGGNTIFGQDNNAGVNVTTTVGNDYIQTGRSTSSTIQLGSGNDTVVADGVSQVTGTTGHDTITISGLWGVVQTSTGASTVSFLTAGEATTFGNDTVSGSGALDVVAQGPVTTAEGGAGYLWVTGKNTINATGGTGGGGFDLTHTTLASISTAAGATDQIALGAGNAAIATRGSDTIWASAGPATISALSGSATVIGGAGSMAFIEGAAQSSVTLAPGGGASQFTFTNGLAGGALTIAGFRPGTDHLSLNGYGGAPVSSEQLSGGNTYLTLNDHTQVTLLGVTDSAARPVLG